MNKFKALEPQFCVLRTGQKDIPIVDEQGVVVAYVLASQTRKGDEVIEAITRYREAKDLLASCEPVLAMLPPNNLGGKTMLFLIEEFLQGKPAESSTPARTRIQQEARARLEVVEALIVQLDKEWDIADNNGQDHKVREITARLLELREEHRLLKGQL